MTLRWRGRPTDRLNGEALEPPQVEGVPDWLQPALFRWIANLAFGAKWLERLELLVRAPLPRNQKALETALRYDQLLALHLVDELVRLVDDRNAYLDPAIPDLRDMLEEAGSAWAVGRVGDSGMGLVRRVNETEQAALSKAVARGRSASHHLAQGWGYAFQRDPDPEAAYRSAVMAVEAAGSPVVSPDNARSTLGTMVRDLDSKPDKWTVEPGLELDAVVAAMRALWQNQTRHGEPGDGPQPTETVPEAQAAVRTALYLVGLFESGAVRPK